MNISAFSILSSALCCLAWQPAMGIDYHVATDGSDASSGSAASPWRTIQKAANTLLPGDKVTVRPGSYDERITTARSGTNEASRISFRADGKVNTRGWVINHAYITLSGFDITGHTSPISTDSFVKVNVGGNQFELSNCTLRDGYAIKREDMAFAASNQISSATGGFLAAGFFPGQSIALRRGTNISLASPLSNYTLSSVSNNTLTVIQNTIVTDGPKPAYVTGSPNFGVYLASTTTGAVIRSNVFRNLSYVFMLVLGSNHLFEANLMEQNNGWDMIVLGGTDHVFRNNLIRNFGWGVYDPSPDIIDNYGNTKFERVTFTNNFIQNVIGVISVQKAITTVVSGPLLLTHNVFEDIGFFWGQYPNTRIEHNTFLRVARKSTPAVQVERHALIFNTQNYATNAIIRNNIFVDCGEATGNVPWSEVGWYRFIGPTNTVTTTGNFVAGSPPGYAAKTAWTEGNPILNGGDPGFVNINDPLGSDGIPFTDDDGLRLLPTSKLVSAGGGGRTIGAYELPGGGSPALKAQLITANQMRLTWPKTVETWMLQSSLTPIGPWTNSQVVPLLESGWLSVNLSPAQAAAFFRLMH